MAEKEKTSWHEVRLPLKKLSLKEQVRSSDTVAAITGVFEEAKQVYHAKSGSHKVKGSGTAAERKWLEQMTKDGTAHDRIAAITLQLNAPEQLPFKLPLLNDLVGMGGRHGHSSRKATDALIELFTEKVLPPDRRLKAFASRNLRELPDNKKEREQVLFYWYVEDYVKNLFSKFLELLREGANSTVDSVKGYCIRCVYTVLSKVPEEERVLLTLLVNKLGDVVPKMATRAVHYILQLLKEHPSMKLAVVKEVEAFMFRKNNPLKAQHYAVTILSQIMLSRGDQDLPQKLLEIYFAAFQKAAKEKHLSNRLVNGLLTGIRRAFPFSRSDGASMEKFYTPLFAIAAVSAFPHRVAALTILFQLVEKGEKSLHARYYNSLYTLLLASPLNVHNMTASKLALFFSLLYKSLRFDTDAARVLAFVHRLLQICLQQRPSYICGALFLVAELLGLNKKLHPHITRRGPLLLPSTTEGPKVVKGGGEGEERSDEEEGGVIKEGVEEEEGEDEGSDLDIDGFAPTKVVRAEKKREEGLKKVEEKRKELPVRQHTVLLHSPDVFYDPGARNPCAARAEVEYLWAINSLCKHYHPSVSLFAHHVREVKNVTYEGDPLEDFTLQAFLDAFSFKNPKKKHVQTIKDSMDAALRRPKTRRATLTHDAAAFSDLPANRIDIQDAFFYKYFKTRQAKLAELQKEAEAGEEARVEVEGLREDTAPYPKPLAEEPAGGGGGDDDNDDDDFARKFFRFSYDSMMKDRNVMEDYLQDKAGATDEAVDAAGVMRDALRGRDAVEDESIAESDLGVDHSDGEESDDDEDDEDSESRRLNASFKQAVQAGEAGGEGLDDGLLAEMDANAERSKKKVLAVPEDEEEGEEGEGTDDEEEDEEEEAAAEALLNESEEPLDEEDDDDDDDDDDDEDEPSGKKRRTGAGKSERGFDVTKGSMQSMGKIDPKEFASIIEYNSKIGSSKYDSWLDKHENRTAAARRRASKGPKGAKGGKGGGGGKKGKGGKGGKGGKKGNKRKR